jgi:hypothetical protein
LFLLQVIVALIAAGAVVWFLRTVWFPPVRESIRNLPEAGALRGGQLEISDFPAERLVTNRFVSFAMDVKTERRHSWSADVFVVVRRAHFEVCSLFGCGDFRYPVSNAPFNRLELEAKWGAWEPILLGIAATATALSLVFTWWILASLYFVFVWVLAFVRDRVLTLGGSWRLCGAALLPGALLLTSGIVGYGFGVLDLIRLLIVAVVHVVLPWGLITWAISALPRAGEKLSANPFVGGKPQPDSATHNPFQKSS